MASDNQVDRPRPSAPSVQVQAAATVGNFGPGFDCFSLALAGLGDHVTLRAADEDTLSFNGPNAEAVPLDWRRNCIGATLDALRAATGVQERFQVDVVKGQPGGSGLGSSASSSGGAALAFAALYPDAGLGAEDLVRAAGAGEAVAAGRHHDDVAAVILGGLALVLEGPDGPSARRVQPPDDLHLAAVAPELEVPTREMRALLPAQVPLADAVHNAARTAALVDACHAGDVAAVGACLDDRLATPYRARRLDYLPSVRAAAGRAGAYGSALSGSGPAVVAVCDDQGVATEVADAMLDALVGAGETGRAFVARPEFGEPYAIANSGKRA
ncbi:MAG: homoserine kinase [Thermoplasmatota archaeon]